MYSNKVRGRQENKQGMCSLEENEDEVGGLDLHCASGPVLSLKSRLSSLPLLHCHQIFIPFLSLLAGISSSYQLLLVDVEPRFRHHTPPASYPSHCSDLISSLAWTALTSYRSLTLCCSPDFTQFDSDDTVTGGFSTEVKLEPRSSLPVNVSPPTTFSRARFWLIRRLRG
jgi:hypothetical protein